MGDQLNYLNNLNRPNLVDLSLLEKINTYNSPPKISYMYSLIQKAGSATCSMAKDNIFISIVVISLILFLGWCYIEKQRQDALYEKYLQKKLAKSLLKDELNLFSETPEPLNMEKLFNDINNDILIKEETNINKEEVIENMQASVPQTPEREIQLTKREQNLQNSNQIQQSNQIIQEYNQYPSQGHPKGASRDFGQDFTQSQSPLNNQTPVYKQALAQDGIVKPESNQQTQPIGGPVGSSKYMDISGGFNKNSYMLM
jgi:hypothetical protein